MHNSKLFSKPNARFIRIFCRQGLILPSRIVGSKKFYRALVTPGPQLAHPAGSRPPSWLQGPPSWLSGPLGRLQGPPSWLQGPPSLLRDPSSWLQGLPSWLQRPSSWL